MAVIMCELKRLGVQRRSTTSGTGYASLSDLRPFPIDILKIAKVFVGNDDDVEADLPLARAVVQLADALGLLTVAEGPQGRGYLLGSTGVEPLQEPVGS